ESLVIGDHLLGCHRRGGRVWRSADIKSGSNVGPQFGVAGDRRGQALGLIRSEGVHRIDEDRLDPPAAPISIAVIEDRIKKTLRLSRPGSRCDQCRTARQRTQPPERRLLVPIRGKTRWQDLSKKRWPRFRGSEGKLQR